MGGHEFRSLASELAVLGHLLGMLEVERPRICLLPTASGDPERQIADFHAIASRFDCDASHLSLFRLERNQLDPRSHLLAQDLIYVAGGSMLNLLAIWRAHGLPEIMREAYESGILLAGQSAGAMCWFEQGITQSTGEPRAASGLGLLDGSLCVHYARDPERRTAYLAAIARGMPAGFACDDGAGILFEDGKAVEAFAARQGARVFRVASEGGAAVEVELRPIPLSYEMRSTEDDLITELRELRRSGWQSGVTRRDPQRHPA